MVLAPVQAKTPPTSHITNATPGDGTFVSMDPGDVKMPLPITMLTTMANASVVPRFLENVLRSAAGVLLGALACASCSL